MIIRHFQASDYSPVADLIKHTYSDSTRLASLTPERLKAEITERGGDPRKDYLVLESQKGELVGFCGYFTPANGGQARMDGPVIAYSERGQGLGQRLWHELVDLMRSRRVSAVSVMLEDQNRIGARFLQRLGFKQGSTQLIVTSDEPYQGKKPDIPGLVLRRVETGAAFDQDAYLALHGKLFEQRSRGFLELLLSLPGYHFFIAERAGEMVGFLELELADDTAIIESFGVHPEQRRKGYGAALLRSALEFAWRQPDTKLIRQIWKTDYPEFLKVYTSLGFRQKAALHQMTKAIET